MELYFRPISEEHPRLEEIQSLYEASFPPNERRPFSALFSEFHGEGELLAVLENDRLAGLVMLLSFEDITHILYLAVPAELRDQGYGSRILDMIRQRYPGQRIVADLERPEKDSVNKVQRERRVDFYRKNGYLFTEVAYRWEGEDYFIMSNGGDVTRAEFGRFWQHFYS